MGTSLSARSRRHTSRPSTQGQAHVEDHHPGPLVAHRVEPPLPVGRLHHPEPLLAQVELDQVGDVLVVLDHHDRSGIGGGGHGILMVAHANVRFL